MESGWLLLPGSVCAFESFSSSCFLEVKCQLVWTTTDESHYIVLSEGPTLPETPWLPACFSLYSSNKSGQRWSTSGKAGSLFVHQKLRSICSCCQQQRGGLYRSYLLLSWLPYPNLFLRNSQFYVFRARLNKSTAKCLVAKEWRSSFTAKLWLLESHGDISHITLFPHKCCSLVPDGFIGLFLSILLFIYFEFLHYVVAVILQMSLMWE